MTIWTDTIALGAGTPAATDHRRANSAPAKARLGTAVRRAIEGLRHWRRRRRAIAELGTLDDHMLKDIGISRGQIRDVVDTQLRLQAGAGTS